MQDIHPIGGGGGRIFGGDRRLRPHQNQALKCPRCDSINTKFCYYNNYNLSQPRHFCKNCRRYWTKGGVLRNVPVGGGCRKTKKSKPKQSHDAERERKSNSHSSSESSSLTAATTTTATEAVSAPPQTSDSVLLNFTDSRFFIPQSINQNFEPPVLNHGSDVSIFSEIGSFTSLITASNDPNLLGLNASDISAYGLHQNNNEQKQAQDSQQQLQWQLHKMTSMAGEELKLQEINSGFVDQTVQVDLPGLQNRAGNGVFAPLDWQSGGADQTLYDFTGTVDQAYWNQNQWSDNDHTLYLP